MKGVEGVCACLLGERDRYCRILRRFSRARGNKCAGRAGPSNTMGGGSEEKWRARVKLLAALRNFSPLRSRVAARVVVAVRLTGAQDSPRRTGASKMSKIGRIVSASYSCAVTVADMDEDRHAGKDCVTLPDDAPCSAVAIGRRSEDMAG